MAELIEIRFGMWTAVGPMNDVLGGGPQLPTGRGFWWKQFSISSFVHTWLYRNTQHTQRYSHEGSSDAASAYEYRSSLQCPPAVGGH